jgi:hypothetical protein
MDRTKILLALKTEMKSVWPAESLTSTEENGEIYDVLYSMEPATYEH